MNLLAFDTSTETLSIAVEGGSARAPLLHTAAGGARASLELIPQIRSLLSQAGLQLAQLDAIVFGCGPGSFTGLRTACSVAQGLALGAGVPVLPVETLLAVAEEARNSAGFDRVVAVLDARMDEVYAGAYLHDGTKWRREGGFTLAAPQALAVPQGWAMAGNALAVYADRLPSGCPLIEAMPTARALLRLAPGLLADGQGVTAAEALPLYIRDKVAQTTEERAQARAARPSPP